VKSLPLPDPGALEVELEACVKLLRDRRLAR
jgi:hypothetical protein